MAKRGMPGYQRIAEEILRMLASREIGQDFNVPEVAAKLGEKDWSVRKAAEYLEERGLIEAHQGSGYQALITPEQAASSRMDDRSLRAQLAEVQQAVAELRSEVPPGLADKLEWIVAALEDVYERNAWDLPGDGTSERGQHSTPAARRAAASNAR